MIVSGVHCSALCRPLTGGFSAAILWADMPVATCSYFPFALLVVICSWHNPTFGRKSVSEVAPSSSASLHSSSPTCGLPAHIPLTDSRIRATLRCGNQCFINASFVALCASVNVRNTLRRVLLLGAEHCYLPAGSQVVPAKAWEKLHRISSAVAPERDAALRTADALGYGNNEQRLALTLAESLRQPLSSPFVPRLLWHRFYNWAAEEEFLEMSTQEDAHELLVKLVDGDMDKSPILQSMVRHLIVPKLVCTRMGCRHSVALDAAVEDVAVLELDLLHHSDDCSDAMAPVLSVQAAVDHYLSGEVISPADGCKVQYNGKAWSCQECGSCDHPRKENDVAVFGDCLIVHLKRWRTSVDASGRVCVDHVGHEVCVDESLIFSGVRYVLKSILLHQGRRMHAGHYFTLCKHTHPEEQWWYYNDALRRHARKTDIEQGVNLPYIYIYMRV